jgi:hypothetical protein
LAMPVNGTCCKEGGSLCSGVPGTPATSGPAEGAEVGKRPGEFAGKIRLLGPQNPAAASRPSIQAGEAWESTHLSSRARTHTLTVRTQNQAGAGGHTHLPTCTDCSIRPACFLHPPRQSGTGLHLPSQSSVVAEAALPRPTAAHHRTRAHAPRSQLTDSLPLRPTATATLATSNVLPEQTGLGERGGRARRDRRAASERLRPITASPTAIASTPPPPTTLPPAIEGVEPQLSRIRNPRVCQESPAPCVNETARGRESNEAAQAKASIERRVAAAGKLPITIALSPPPP